MDELTKRQEEKVAQLAAEYTARGYSVQTAPAAAQLPAFLQGLEPDLIARGPSESIVVEVKVGDRRERQRWADLADRVPREPGWHFRLVVLGSTDTQGVDYELMSPTAITTRVQRAKDLTAVDPEAALLLGWTAFEAAARRSLIRWSASMRTESPASLAKQLVHHGLLDADELPRLLRAAQHRNTIAHGGTSASDLDEDVAALSAFTTSLLAA